MTGTHVLVVFAVACGIPCEELEWRAHCDQDCRLYTLDECLDQREPVKHEYLMEHNKLVWVVCQREVWDE